MFVYIFLLNFDNRLTERTTSDFGLIATFWTQFQSDVVYYREANDIPTILRINNAVKQLQNTDFNATSVLIVTW